MKPAFVDQSAASEMIREARELCQAEWGEFPKLAEMHEENGDWLLRFWNHAADQNPSTIVQGDHRRLLIAGHHAFNQDFYLPEGMTANELGDHLAMCFGLKSPPVIEADATAEQPRREQELLSWRETALPPLDEMIKRSVESGFPEPISDQPLTAIRQRYRDKMGASLFQFRMFDDHQIVKSGEGIGKSTTFLSLVTNEVWDEACRRDDGGVERFAVFAFRSRDQAEARAEEFRQKGRNVVVMRPARMSA